MPGFQSSTWLRTMEWNERVISLGVPADHLLHPALAVPPMTAFLAKAQKGIACRLTEKPAIANLNMIRAARDIMECPYTGRLKEGYCDLKLSNLLIMAMAGFVGEAQEPRVNLKPLDVEKIETARRHLLDQVDCPVALVRLARNMGINDHNLKKNYRQLYGTTLLNDFLHARMQKAKHLLRETAQSIVGIAETIGYKNVSSFSVAFKRYFGCPPGECRKAD